MVVVNPETGPSVEDIASAFVAVWSTLPGAPSLTRAPSSDLGPSFLCAQVPIDGGAGVGAHVHVDVDLARDLCASIPGLASSSGRDLDEAVLVDIVGELANQLAGALKVFFGSSFSLSVPRVRRVSCTDLDSIDLAVSWVSPSGFVSAGLDLNQ